MLALLTVLSPNANAYVYWGNPKIVIEIDRFEADLTDGDAYLSKVRVHNCGGGHTDYTVNAWIDPVDGWSTVITGGDLCKVSTYWGSNVEVSSNAFDLKSGVAIHTVTLGGTTQSTPWTPFTVTSGTFTGTDPDVVVTID